MKKKKTLCVLRVVGVCLSVYLQTDASIVTKCRFGVHLIRWDVKHTEPTIGMILKCAFGLLRNERCSDWLLAAAGVCSRVYTDGPYARRHTRTDLFADSAPNRTHTHTRLRGEIECVYVYACVCVDVNCICLCVTTYAHMYSCTYAVYE